MGDMIAQLITNKWPNAQVIFQLSHGKDVLNAVIGTKKWMTYMSPAEYILIKSNSGSVLGIFATCPNCGVFFITSNKHRHIILRTGNLEISPSIHNKHCCGWHGWLKNGEFTKC